MSAQELKALVDDFTSYFVSLYKQQPGQADTQPILSTLPIGVPVSVEELRLHPDDPGPSPVLAAEWMSMMANEAPDIDGMQLFRTSRTIDGLYQLMLRGAQLAPGAAAGNLSLFESTKANAMRTFDNTELGSAQGIGSYHPVTARPATWADPANTPIWTQRTFSSSTRTSVTTGAPAPKRPIVPWTLQVIPKAIAPALAQPQLLDKSIAAHKAAVSPRVAQVAMAHKAVAMAPKVAMTAKLMTARPFMAQATPVALKAEAAPTPAVSSLKSERLVRSGQLAATLRTKSTSVKSIEATPMLTATKLASLSVAAGRTLELAQLAEPHKTEASNVSISFEYCLVSLSRSWFDLTLLNLKGWHVPGFRRGELSSGKLGDPESADTLLEALPAAALLIRKLRLTASWSSDELSVLGASAGFGPFSLVGRSVDAASGTVSCDGTQLVGWVCEPLPVLPPESDPSLPT
jgi:hypothetical protein